MDGFNFDGVANSMHVNLRTMRLTDRNFMAMTCSAISKLNFLRNHPL